MTMTMNAREIVLFDADKHQYYRLDEMAAAVWNMVNSPVSLQELRDALVERFGMEPEAAERELLSVLAQMETEGLIEKRRTTGTFVAELSERRGVAQRAPTRRRWRAPGRLRRG